MKPRTKQESFWSWRFRDGRRLCVNTMRDSRYTKRGMSKQRRITDKQAIDEQVFAMIEDPEKEEWQMPEFGQHDTGTWTVDDDGRQIYSTDFTHDVMITIGGDFVDDAQRKRYADNIADRLNKTRPESIEAER